MSSNNDPDLRHDWVVGISDKIILRCLTDHRNDSALKIEVEVIKPSEAIKRESSNPDLGTFDKLPTELLHEIFGHLDFRSLLQFSATSLPAKSLVASFPAYRDVMAHASKALNALAQVGLLDHFPAKTLRQTLGSDRCTSCHGYGQYLHLLLCERVCHKCLKHNPALWVLSSDKARQIFDLKPSHLKKLPALRRVPRSGRSGQFTEWKNGTRYSVKMVKEMALKIHGGPLQYEAFQPMDLVQAGTRSIRSQRLGAHLRAAVVTDDVRFEAPETEVGYYEHTLGEGCYKTTAIEICHITEDKTVSYGNSCRGCNWLARGVICNDPQLVGEMLIFDWLPDFGNATDFCYDVIGVARSEAEHLAHVRGCVAVQVLLDSIAYSGFCLGDLGYGCEDFDDDENMCLCCY